MTGAPAWGAKPSKESNWADDVEEYEKEIGGELQAPAAIADKSFPSLGEASTQSKGKKKSKSKVMNLADFNAGSVGFGADKRADILARLPKHATGEESEHGFRGPHRAQRFDSEPSKADDSNNWGSDRISQPSGRSGGFNREGRESRGGFGGGFGASDGEGAWARGGGQPPPREGGRMGGGFGGNGFSDGPSRADEGGAWARGSQPPPRDGGRMGGGFGGGGPRDDAPWARGSQAQPPAPGRGFDGPSRADEAGAWSRGSAVQPQMPRMQHSRADEESRWSRAPRPAGPPHRGPDQSDVRGPREADLSDNWNSQKPARASGSAGGGGTGSGSQAGGSDRSRPDTPKQSQPDTPKQQHRSTADEVDRWASTRPSAPAATSTEQVPVEDSENQSPRVSKGASVEGVNGKRRGGGAWRAGDRGGAVEGKWGSTRKPSEGQAAGVDRAKARAPTPVAVASEQLEPAGPSQEEQDLRSNVERLQIEAETGNGEADADDVDENGDIMTVAQALKVSQAKLQTLTEERETAASRASTGENNEGKWARKPAPTSPAPTAGVPQGKPAPEHAQVGAAVESLDPEDATGFETVVSRSTAKKAAKTPVPAHAGRRKAPPDGTQAKAGW